MAAALLLYFFVFKKDTPTIDYPTVQWHQPLMEKVLFYQQLNDVEQRRFRYRMAIFLEDTYVESVGFELEELDRVLVAASAVIPVFKFPAWHYDELTGVILYPDNFNKDLEFDHSGKDRFIGGLVGTGRYKNQMILSKTSLYHGFDNQTDKRNTGIHEFVHLIDKTDGDTDGVPEVLLKQSYVIPWINLMHQKMDAINKDKSDIRAYGGTSQAEFFATAAEYFFSRPKLMRRKHPELYRMLKQCFDPSLKKAA